MYSENAIPTSIRFMQHFAESRLDNTPFNQWEQRVLPDYLFSQFCQYIDAQRETKKWTSKSFQMSITKYLGIKADIRDRSNNTNARFYCFGNSAEEFIEVLKSKRLYSNF